MEQPPKKYRSRVFGGILRWMNPTTSCYEYVCVKGRATSIWSFPKGHSHRGEQPLECAEREIEEETGVNCLPPYSSHQKLGSVNLYVYDLPQKYPVEAYDTREVEEVKWCTLEEMTYLHGNKGLTEYVARQRRRILSIF